MSEQNEPFLARWSRLKIEAREAQPENRQSGPESKPNPPPEGLPRPASAGADAGAAPAKVLPPVDSLQGLASEYREFLHPEVDDGLRRAALKKLFSDPHFNTMDGLDVYIDDYGKPDPIPEAMLRTLEHAKGLLFDLKEEQGAGEQPAADPARTGASPSPESTQDKTAPGPASPSADGPMEPAAPPTSGPKS